MYTKLAKYLHADSTGGILLIITTVLALLFVNSPFSHLVAKNKDGNIFSPLREIEGSQHPWIVFFILPLFAFANAGIYMRDISISHITDPVPMGIMLGLFLSRQIGVFRFSWISIKPKITSLLEGSGWLMLYDVCILIGIGFTMSLFIDSLAFIDKLAITIGSFASAVIGYLILKFAINENSISKEGIL